MELGQTSSAKDLISGSASTVRDSAAAWKARAVHAEDVRDALSKLDDDGTWQGDAYDRYLERFERQLLHWQQTGESLRSAANALYTWADALEWAQDEADRAITIWDEAELQRVTALAMHDEQVRSLNRGRGLRGIQIEVPFNDPSTAKREEAQEVLFNARAILEVFARDCATQMDDAADAATMPLTESEAAEQRTRDITNMVLYLGVVQPFTATMDTLAVAAQTLWEHPDIILELLGGAATFVGGGALALGGGGISITGVGAVAGVPALATGVTIAGAGAVAMGDAIGRWSQESHQIADRRRGHDRGDGRDYAGTFAKGQDSKPWVDKEKIGLDKHAKDNDVEVIRTKVKVDYDGSPQDGRFYDGLVENADGTYTAIEVKSGSAIDKYYSQSTKETQRVFDDAVNNGTPAHGSLNGEDITITEVIVRKEP